MVHPVTHRRNGKKSCKSAALQLRGALMLRGLTLHSIGAQHGVSRQMVWKLVRGLRPGRRGRSAAVLATIDRALGKKRAP